MEPGAASAAHCPTDQYRAGLVGGEDSGPLGTAGTAGSRSCPRLWAQPGPRDAAFSFPRSSGTTARETATGSDLRHRCPTVPPGLLPGSAGVSGSGRGDLGCAHAAASPRVHKTPEVPVRLSFRVEVFDIEFMTGQGFPGGSGGSVAAGGSASPWTRLRSSRRLGGHRVRLLLFLRGPKGAGGAAERSRHGRTQREREEPGFGDSTEHQGRGASLRSLDRCCPVTRALASQRNHRPDEMQLSARPGRVSPPARDRAAHPPRGSRCRGP